MAESEPPSNPDCTPLPSIQKINTQLNNKIINLSSEEEKQINHKSNKPNDQPKPKKPTIKCKLCKGNGRKNQMKQCIQCQSVFHLACVENAKFKKKYVCQWCLASNQTLSKPTRNKGKCEEKNQQMDKALLKKLQKAKKKQICQRTLEIFKQKYSYYVGNDGKIQFPIQDKLLYIYKEFFDLSEHRPSPIHHPIIPKEILGHFLELQNFLTSFQQELQQFYKGFTSKSTLYSIMNCEGSDGVFQQLLAAIVRIYLKDIFDRNKTENVKYLNENQFFITIGHLLQMSNLSSQCFYSIVPEIISYLCMVPSMKKAFEKFTFPHHLNIKTKIYTLITLIQGLSEIDAFHDMVSKKSQKMAEMTKEKASLLAKLKNQEAEVLSHRQNAKFLLSNIKSQFTHLKDSKKLKQLQKEKKKTEKSLTQYDKSEEVFKEIRDRINHITRSIPFAISQVLFLGSDRNNSKYYFFLHQPHRIYVQYNNFLLDNAQHYLIYEGKDKIVQLYKSLNTKGINEKHLHESLGPLIKEDLIEKTIPDNVSIPHFKRIFAVYDKNQMMKKIVVQLLQTEQKYTWYLKQKSYQWASEDRRKQLIGKLKNIIELHQFKAFIQSLHENMIHVEVVQQKQSYRIDSDSNDGPVMIEQELSKKKKSIRIWGINSEKIKRYWMIFLNSTNNFAGVWICVQLLCLYIRKYIEKKTKQSNENEKKRTKNEKKQQKNHQKLKKMENQSVQIINHETGGPNLRKSTKDKNRPLLIEDSQESQIEVQEIISSSDDDPQCEVCNGYGTVICCDTCPKIFHLQCLNLKEIPEGEWSCLSCLERLSNTRKTRSMSKIIK